MTLAQRVGATLVVFGLATAALAAGWVSPFGIKHVNDETCNTEACVRHCRICCLHFNPDITTTDWKDCNNTCSDCPATCPNGTDGR